MIIEILAIVGILVSFYAYKIRKSNKKAFCDFNKKWSCSEVLKSKQAQLFLLPNSVWGIIYFVLVLILTLVQQHFIVFLLSVLATIGSIVLAVKMLKMKKYCVICIVAYILIIAILLIAAF